IFPVPKIMAFGGVPTGSMKAQFAATAHGTMSAYGWIFSAIASDATTGKNIDPVAVLDVISVINRTTVVDTDEITMKFIPSRDAHRSPIQLESPVSVNPPAITRPPPNRMRIPHGISFASFQSINFVSSSSFAGI